MNKKRTIINPIGVDYFVVCNEMIGISSNIPNHYYFLIVLYINMYLIY